MSEDRVFPGPYMATVKHIVSARIGNDGELRPGYVVAYLNPGQKAPEGFIARDSVTVTLSACLGLDPTNPPAVGSEVKLTNLKVHVKKDGRVKGWRAERAELS